MLLRRSKEQRHQAIEQQDKETLNELSVTEVFERRLAQEPEMAEARKQRMSQMFQQVVEAVRHQDQEPNQ
ncbi:Nuclease sbcCD subunit D [Serratia liquefaciens]|nr:Nuclease sbcCD subunit D [Serratia liquefaciens]